MTLTSKSNIALGIKRQTGIGVPASGSSAGYELLPGPIMTLSKGQIQNTVVRSDGQRKRNRHGIKAAQVAYKLPLQQGVLDPLFEAAFRSVFTASFTVLPADITSITFPTTSTISGASGSFLTKGVRRGMKMQIANATQAGNNSKWVRIVGVTASTITVAGTPFTVDLSADTTFTLTFAKYLTNPIAGSLVEYYHTIDEYDGNQDLSTLGTDFKITKIDFNAQPEALIEVTVTMMGLDVAPQTSGASPVLTKTYATGVIPLVMMDGTIRVNGVDYSVMTGVQWSWDMGGETPKTLSTTSPDVVLGTGGLSGSFTALRQDLTFLTAFRSETVVDLFIDCQEPDPTDPKDFTSFYIGNATLSGDTPDGVAQSGALAETVPWSAGIDDQGSDHALTSMLISSSAP